jgi:hypothetical protein
MREKVMGIANAMKRIVDAGKEAAAEADFKLVEGSRVESAEQIVHAMKRIADAGKEAADPEDVKLAEDSRVQLAERIVHAMERIADAGKEAAEEDFKLVAEEYTKMADISIAIIKRAKDEMQKKDDAQRNLARCAVLIKRLDPMMVALSEMVRSCDGLDSWFNENKVLGKIDEILKRHGLIESNSSWDYIKSGGKRFWRYF